MHVYNGRDIHSLLFLELRYISAMMVVVMIALVVVVDHTLHTTYVDWVKGARKIVECSINLITLGINSMIIDFR